MGDVLKAEFELENQLIEQLILQGYEKVNVKDENSLVENLKIQLEKLNKRKFS